MADETRNVRIVFSGDGSSLVGTHDEMAAAAQRTADATAEAEAAAKKAAKTEAQLAGELKASKTAFDKRAKQLGVTTSELRKLDKEMKTNATLAKKTADAAKKAATAEKALAEEAQAAAGSLGGMAESAGDGEQALVGIADLLDLVDPRLGVVARTAGEVGGAFEGIVKGGEALGATGTSIAAVGVAVGAAAAAAGVAFVAYKGLTEESTRNDQIGRAMAASYRDVIIPILNKTRDALIDTREATGDLSAEEAAALRASTAAYGDYQSAVEETEAEIRELREQQEGHGASLAAYADGLSSLVDPFGLAAAAVDAMTESSDELQVRIDAYTDRIKLASDSTREFVDQETAARESQEAAAAAAEAKAEADRAAADAEREYAAAVAEAEAATASASAVALAASSSQLEGINAIQFARGQQLVVLDDLLEKGASLASVEAGRVAVNAQAEAEITAILQEQSAARQAIVDEEIAATEEAKEASREKQKAADKAAAEERISDLQGLASQARDVLLDLSALALSSTLDTFGDAQQAFADLTDTATDAEKDAAREKIRTTKEAARKAFVINKAASIADTSINGIVAVGKTLAQFGFTPVGIAAAALSAAATGIQIATIQSQDFTFDDGGMIREAATRAGLAPGQVNITARDGEAVLTNQGVSNIGGPDAVAAANQGRSAGGSSMIRAQFVVGPKTSGDQFLQAMGANGQVRRSTQTLRPTGRVNPFR